MVKTLVTLGYHYAELEWGRTVRSAYYKNGLRQGRKVCFYEVKSSDVETAYPCLSSLKEIRHVMKDGNFDVWIDIHCGVESGYKDILAYKTDDRNKIKRARMLPDVAVGDFLAIPSRHRSDILRNSALADVFMPQRDYERRENRFVSGLERTIQFINQIHDIQ